MFDALLCYQILANMIRAGYFAGFVDVLRRMTTRWRPICAVAALKRKAAATGANGTSPTWGSRAIVCRIQDDWTLRLSRLETYVASMR